MTQRIKIMNEYGVSWPVWDESGPASRNEPLLSETLSRRLESWARSFNDHVDPFDGWDDQALREPHRVEARELLDLVAAELGAGCTVVLDLWEV